MTSQADPGYTGMTDEELIALVKEGDSSAYDELFERYNAKVFSFISRYLRYSPAAEDVFQETFIRLYTRAHRYRKESRLSTWLYTIAANLCRDELRKTARRKNVSLDALSGTAKEGHDVPPTAEIIPDNSPGPAGLAEKEEIGRIVRKAMDELPEKLGIVASLHGIQKLRYREIADILKIPVGTVQSRMHAAIEFLRKRLRGIDPNG